MGEDDKAYYRGILGTEDAFFKAKFDDDGNVRPEWSFEAWTLERSADIKPFGSKHCHTTLRP